MWQPSGKMMIMDLENGYSVIRLELEDDYWRILLGGPWNIFGKALMVKKWDLSFNPEKDAINTVSTWIRLSNLPIILYEE
ncbi:hypothetical protein V2J09_012393 [Rumex salicifolius]